MEIRNNIGEVIGRVEETNQPGRTNIYNRVGEVIGWTEGGMTYNRRGEVLSYSENPGLLMWEA